jgi:hypothetical protein
MTRSVFSQDRRRKDPGTCRWTARAAAAHVDFFAVGGEVDAVHRTDVDAGIALDAQLVGKDRLHVAVQAALRPRKPVSLIEAEFDLDLDVGFSASA